ncbi:MAG: hypothetical protein IJ737_07720 [Ruminococcus sp.]|nr:hypothetical protein [Ruminococcus sp.]
MKEIIIAVLFICVPMAVTQFGYLILDKNGSRTTKILEKAPAIARRKFLFQIILPLFFIVVFGLVSVLCKLPIRVFFAVAGAVVGLINGIAVRSSQ